ncbi:hypothetical protein WR25_16388 [Diploscapter pachys]|uniref:Uncharacterized protein n=1 Tax=Diploscapter pachys TaxID=2018661 RepID=A0A2A2K9B2_9BILA|nr:hypothetical protein WR25_16388 [Diploscapter pachys]
MQRHVLGQAIDAEFDRQALDDLHPIAGGIFRRQQGEAVAGAGAEAGQPAGQFEVGEGIDMEGRALPDPHVVELVFFEIALDPQARARQREHRLGGGNVAAALQLIDLGDDAVLRGAHDRVAEQRLLPRRLAFRIVEACACRRKAGLALAIIGAQQRHLRPRIGKVCRRLVHGGLEGGGIDAEQDVARAHALVVVNHDRDHRSAYAGGDRHQPRLHIAIVGRLITPAAQIDEQADHDRKDGGGEQQRQTQPAASCRRRVDRRDDGGRIGDWRRIGQRVAAGRMVGSGIGAVVQAHVTSRIRDSPR